MKNTVIAVASIAALAGAAFGQASIDIGPSLSYSQDFDGLANAPKSNLADSDSSAAYVPAQNFLSWTNGVTLAGWNNYRFGGTINVTGPENRLGVANGANNVGGTTFGTPIPNNSFQGMIYSFGTDGSTDRALGSVGSNSQGGNRYTLVLRNNTGLAITAFGLSYDGEQWRDGGQGSFAPTLHRMDFQFGVFASFNDTILNSAAGFTDINTLDFTGPVSAITTTNGAALDGNAAANRIANINGGALTSVLPGEFLVLRWTENNDAGNDHALAIDNVKIGVAVVPTPGVASVLGLGLLAAARRRRA